MTTHRVRRSQIIGTFGPGAIIDLVGESFVAEDAGNWRGRPTQIEFARLASRLKVPELHTPPPNGELPYYRFPQWLFCPHCRGMLYWVSRMEAEQDGFAPSCIRCVGRRRMVPMRFVAVCGNGHLTDVDWYRWAHSDPINQTQKNCRIRDNLRFDSRSDMGSGLRSLAVACQSCGARRTLEDITVSYALRQIGMKCTGRQPWQIQSDAQACDENLVAMQRGASSVYFPNIVSAIDIPPDSDWAVASAPITRLLAHSDFRSLAMRPDHPLRDALVDVIRNDLGLSREDIERALAAESTPAGQTFGPTPGTVDDILPEEWEALTAPPRDHDIRDTFITRRAERFDGDGDTPALAELDRILEKVVLVDRLREARVLTSFERHTTKQEVPANLAPRVDYLPAVEVFGEGFFLVFREQAIRDWELQPEVQRRCVDLADRASRAKNSGMRWLREPTPRFVLLHTLAHLLLRRTAFEAGYATSSLRERLYATDPRGGPTMAGILIYTAAGDTEGTLGGLVRLGEHQRLSALLSDAVESAQWCSFDPVCGESPGQGPDALSLAACHACALVPETSCEAANRLLDRQLVVNADFGFFAPLIDLVTASATGAGGGR